MGSYQWKLSDKIVCVRAESVNLEGESILQKLFLYLVILLTVGINKIIYEYVI
jgi:hypothetical protein